MTRAVQYTPDMIDIHPPDPEQPPTRTIVDMVRASARAHPGRE